jgi:hypothetical protein
MIKGVIKMVSCLAVKAVKIIVKNQIKEIIEPEKIELEKIKNQKSKIKNQKSKIKNQKSKIKNQKSKIKK